MRVLLFMWLTCMILLSINECHGHELHLTNKIGQPNVVIVADSFDGMTFETTDGKCYMIYKAEHEVITYPTQLHIREVTCK